jgi:site-specific recombinase XerC
MNKIPELNYRSFLADAMRDYLDYLDHLGFSIVPQASRLRRIDGFLAENNIGCMQQCDSRLWLRLMAQYQGRVKGTTIRLWRNTFNGLCRYLVRQGWMPENPVPAFPVPRIENYRPYVFSIDELRRFFDWLQQQADHSGDPLTSFRFRSRYVFYNLL